MSELEKLGRFVGSLRYARDLIENWSGQVTTKPWWTIDLRTPGEVHLIAYPERNDITSPYNSERPIPR